LIIIALVSRISEVKHFFDYCKLVHKIFSFKFKSFYTGNTITRLLEAVDRSSSCYNYSKIIEALSSNLTNCNELDGNAMVECNGLLTIMKTRMFRFILCAILKLLQTIEPANKFLQTRENGLGTALPLIHSVYSYIKDYRSDTIFERVMKECTDLLPDVDETADNNRISKRKVNLLIVFQTLF